jgi:curved DNA-binding protein CbpA
MATDPLANTKLLNEAYAILSNEKLRQKYDQENGYDKVKQNDKIRAHNFTKAE